MQISHSKEYNKQRTNLLLNIYTLWYKYIKSENPTRIKISMQYNNAPKLLHKLYKLTRENRFLNKITSINYRGQ